MLDSSPERTFECLCPGIGARVCGGHGREAMELMGGVMCERWRMRRGTDHTLRSLQPAQQSHLTTAKSRKYDRSSTSMPWTGVSGW